MCSAGSTVAAEGGAVHGDTERSVPMLRRRSLKGFGVERGEATAGGSPCNPGVATGEGTLPPSGTRKGESPRGHQERGRVPRCDMADGRR